MSLSPLENESLMDIKIDLSELRGYKYHSSVSFTVHVEGPEDLSVEPMSTFLLEMVPRPGTGFSADLNHYQGSQD